MLRKIEHQHKKMKFTYYGHACFQIEVSGKKLLFDPFIRGNDLANHIDINSIEADYILVSHGHGDHVGDLVDIANRTNALVIGAYEVMEWAGKQGVAQVHPMNFGGKKTFDWGSVKFLPAQHSSVLPDGTYGGNPGGFLITTNEGNFYYSGDTCLMMDMQLVPRYASVNFSILPVGDNFTMGVEDAMTAAEFLQCKKVIGVHFDTFGWIKIDHQQSIEQFRSKGLELVLPKIGETIDIN